MHCSRTTIRAAEAATLAASSCRVERWRGGFLLTQPHNILLLHRNPPWFEVKFPTESSKLAKTPTPKNRCDKALEVNFDQFYLISAATNATSEGSIEYKRCKIILKNFANLAGVVHRMVSPQMHPYKVGAPTIAKATTMKR
jgi:hypothetical protein